MYHLFRSQTHPDRMISIPSETDSIVRRHLLAMDRVFLDHRAEDQKAEIEKMKARAGKNPRVKKEI